MPWWAWLIIGLVVNMGEEVIAAGFETNAAAWRWLDERDGEHLSAIDRFNRIRAAFSGDD